MKHKTRRTSVFKELLLDISRNKILYLLILPIILWYIIFCYVPMGGILMSFQQFNPAKGILGSKWIGLQHFQDFFHSMYFGRLLRNTITLSILDLLVNFPLAIIFALLLNEVQNKLFKKVVQTASYMPYFISMVVMCGIIVDLTTQGGVISNLVGIFTGVKGQNLLGNANYFRPIYIISNGWQSVGFGSIIYLAALSSVDQEQYEAAVVDGAGRFRQTIHITLPGIASTIIIMLILRMGSLLAVGSEKILLLYSPAIYEKADVISTFVYRKAFEDYNYGFSTAVGLFNSVINTALLLTTNRLSKRYSETSMF